MIRIIQKTKDIKFISTAGVGRVSRELVPILHTVLYAPTVQTLLSTAWSCCGERVGSAVPVTSSRDSLSLLQSYSDCKG